MRGGDHDAGGKVKFSNGEIEAIGRRHAEVDSIDPLVGNTTDQGGG